MTPRLRAALAHGPLVRCPHCCGLLSDQPDWRWATAAVRVVRCCGCGRRSRWEHRAGMVPVLLRMEDLEE